MNNTQENILTMCYAADKALDKHTAAWTPHVPFAAAVAEFKANLDAWENAAERQAINLKGFAMRKRTKKKEMVEVAYGIARVVFAYAEDTSNPPLQETVNYSVAELSTGRDAFVGQRCQGIHTAANGVIASLAPYGILPADLTALQAAIDAYLATVAEPRHAVTERKGATAEIDVLTRNTSKLLERRLDPLMEEYRSTDPTFYQEYFDARIIIDLGTGDKDVAEAA
ncbi:MAG: hypothetical protein IPI55_18330 [Flavobacteriales bacterium]|nr:hypothetical protein [Flavobacteriales bacterium]